jgi:dihydrofolate reductase
MARVIANMSMSLDGYVADTDGGVELLFGWYGNGPVVTPTANAGVTFHTSRVDAEYLRSEMAGVGALVVGRRLYDFAQGWGGTHPLDVPVFVVTHRPPSTPAPVGFTFVGDTADAIGQAIVAAGHKAVAVGSASITQQGLNAGLIDEVHIDLIPVLLGSGLRWFDHLATTITFDKPRIIQGCGATHLAYPVLKLPTHITSESEPHHV